MDVSQLPFNQLIGMEPAPAESGCLVTLPADRKYTNHLGTVHGSALMAVAEAGSGAFLAARLGNAEGFIPVVRRMEAKFRRPAAGRVSARCGATPAEAAEWMRKLTEQGRVSAQLPMEVVDESGAVVLTAVVEWFIAREK